jgi:hypothetical protein
MSQWSSMSNGIHSGSDGGPLVCLGVNSSDLLWPFALMVICLETRVVLFQILCLVQPGYSSDLMLSEIFCFCFCFFNWGKIHIP